jgi:chromosome segregation ATPase
LLQGQFRVFINKKYIYVTNILIFRDQEARFDQTKRTLQAEIDNITFSRDSLQRQKESLEGEISAKSVEVTGLKSTVAELQSAQIGIAAQLDATKVGVFYMLCWLN